MSSQLRTARNAQVFAYVHTKNPDQKFQSFKHFPDPNNDHDSIKLQVPIFSGDDTCSFEDYLHTVKVFKQKMTTMGHWEADDAGDDADASQLFSRITECFEDNAADLWAEALEGEDDTWGNFQLSVCAMNKKVLPHEAHHVAKKYLETTPKPRSLSMREWAKRIQQLTGYLGYLHFEPPNIDDATFLDDHEVDDDYRRDIILDNVPRAWKEKFDLSAIDRTDGLGRIIDYFALCEFHEPAPRDDRRRRGGADDPSDQRRGRQGQDGRRRPNVDPGEGRHRRQNGPARGVPRNTDPCPFHDGHLWGQCDFNARRWRDDRGGDDRRGERRRDHGGGRDRDRGGGRGRREDAHLAEEEEEEDNDSTDTGDNHSVPSDEEDNFLADDYGDADSLDSDPSVGQRNRRGHHNHRR